MSKSDYDQLQATLGLSKVKLSRLKSGSDDFDAEIILALSGVIPEMTAGEIASRFKIARSMSLELHDQLHAQDGNSLKPCPMEMEDTPHEAEPLAA